MRIGFVSTCVVAAVALVLGLLAANAAPGLHPARTLYIALGDSYAAGPGIPTQIDISSGCKRSSHSYPAVVANELGLDASQHRDASCSGAVIADLTTPQNTGNASVPPQLSVLSTDTTLVTLSIGGNDLDFSGIVTRCVELDALGVIVSEVRGKTDHRSPCRTFYTPNGTDLIQQKILAASVTLAAALRRIHDLAPHARVLVVGYPDLLPPSDGGACAGILGITADDVDYLNNEELQLNRVLSNRAAAAGDSYVDTYSPSIGHDACASPSTRWIEPLIPAAPTVPMHPNATGQQEIADIVDQMTTGHANPRP
jgi:lysophospholipase L1-like esterase